MTRPVPHLDDLIETDQLAPSKDVSRGRWVVGLFVGTLLWALAVFIAHSFPVIFLDRELTGPTYAIVALLFAPLAFGAVSVGLRVARRPLSAAGFTLENARADVLVGAAVAVIWAVFQFGIIIPRTTLRGIFGASPAATALVVLVPTVL